MSKWSSEYRRPRPAAFRCLICADRGQEWMSTSAAASQLHMEEHSRGKPLLVRLWRRLVGGTWRLETFR